MILYKLQIKFMGKEIKRKSKISFFHDFIFFINANSNNSIFIDYKKYNFKHLSYFEITSLIIKEVRRKNAK